MNREHVVFILAFLFFQGFQQDGSADESLYIQLERAITDAANAKREAFREAMKRAKAEKDLGDAIRRVILFVNCHGV